MNTTRANVDIMLTASDLARLLHVHINTVRRWSNRGILKSYRLGPRGDRRFRMEDIAVFIAGNGGNGHNEKEPSIAE